MTTLNHKKAPFYARGENRLIIDQYTYQKIKKVVDAVLIIKKKCTVSKMALAIFMANVALVSATTKNESNEDKDKGSDNDEKETKKYSIDFDCLR